MTKITPETIKTIEEALSKRKTVEIHLEHNTVVIVEVNRKKYKTLKSE